MSDQSAPPSDGTPSTAAAAGPYQALLLVSFGGPEGPDDVMPFLENVLRGKPVPRERMLEVAEHYQHFGGKSPINDQCRALLAAIEAELQRRELELPVYWGNRNWHPMLGDTIAQMKSDGIRRAVAFFTSTFSCYSGCRQYRENIQAAREQAGDGAPVIDKLRMCFNHPGFIEPQRERLREALERLDSPARQRPLVLFCAHSIPQGMADNCDYQLQLTEASRLTAEGVDPQLDWRLVFQSRSGPPQQPWLEPDVCDAIEACHAEGQYSSVVLVPIGFVSDHMEVMYDLDEEAMAKANELGLACVRAGTVGVHPSFVSMIVDLIEERMRGEAERPSLGGLGAWHDVCPVNCCLYPQPTGRPRPGG
jgi:protoporphyrin/coproporphyrin ferrochelatase